MLDIAILFAATCFGLALLLNLWRVIVAIGPGDRILALDTMVVNAIALMLLFGMSQGTEIYFEAAMLIAMLGFVSTVAYTRYLLRGNIIE